MTSKLEVGVTAYYTGLVEDDYGDTITEKVEELGLTLEEYQLCKDWSYLHFELHRNDTVMYGCDCGCGGDYLDLDEEDERDREIEKEMVLIEEKLGKFDDFY